MFFVLIHHYFGVNGKLADNPLFKKLNRKKMNRIMFFNEKAMIALLREYA